MGHIVTTAMPSSGTQKIKTIPMKTNSKRSAQLTNGFNTVAKASLILNLLTQYEMVVNVWDLGRGPKWLYSGI